MSPAAIETQNLSKQFGNRLVVDSVTLSIPTGSVVGLLGPNGAGKTTLIRMLMGHLHPTSGTIRTLGGSPWNHSSAVLRRIGYVSQSMRLPGWMTAAWAIAMNERLFPRWDRKLAEELLDEFALRGTGRYRTLSGGQQRKLMLLLALAQNPDLLILDEPAAGLDIESRHVLTQRILDIACDGRRTVVLSSHLLGDLERMVNRIILVRHGRSVADGELDEMKSGLRRLQILADVPASILQEHFDVLSVEQPSLHETLVTVSNFTDERAARFAASLESPELMRVHGFNLEQLYLELK